MIYSQSKYSERISITKLLCTLYICYAEIKMESQIQINSPILSLNPKLAAECFEGYLSTIYEFFSTDLLEEDLFEFKSEVYRLQEQLGLPDSNIEYAEIPILKDDNAIKILAFIAIYHNSEYIIQSIEKLRPKRGIIYNNINCRIYLRSKNQLTGKLRAPKQAKLELKRRFLISIWLQYLLHNMDNNIYDLYELDFTTLERVGEGRFNEMPDIWSSRVLIEGFREAGFSSAEQLNRAINRIKAESHFIIGLRPKGILASTFLGNHIIIDTSFDWRTNKGRGNITNIKASFISIIIHELGHLILRIDDHQDWYSLTPQKAIIQADISKEESISSSALSKSREGEHQATKKFKANSGHAIAVLHSTTTDDLASYESSEESKEPINAAESIQDSQVFIEKLDNEMGSYVETQLFGFVCTHMNIELAEFLLNEQSWDLSLEEFKRRFKVLYKVGLISNSQSAQFRKTGQKLRKCMFDSNRQQQC